jgi:hypothetical protein
VIKQKAPKDMTATEFVAHLELVASREMLAKNLEGWAITLQGLRKELSEPAPNPFTPDQIAWMREEQRNGYQYAAKDLDGNCYLFTHMPIKEDHNWECEKQDHHYSDRRDGFLEKVLSFYDPEPLCFADYAPLEEK